MSRSGSRVTTSKLGSRWMILWINHYIIKDGAKRILNTKYRDMLEGNWKLGSLQARWFSRRMWISAISGDMDTRFLKPKLNDD